MSGKGIYQGYALQAVDEKGRVAIPSSLRATLIARAPAGIDPKDAQTVVLGFHESDPCLIGTPDELVERIRELEHDGLEELVFAIGTDAKWRLAEDFARQVMPRL